MPKSYRRQTKKRKTARRKTRRRRGGLADPYVTIAGEFNNLKGRLNGIQNENSFHDYITKLENLEKRARDLYYDSLLEQILDFMYGPVFTKGDELGINMNYS